LAFTRVVVRKQMRRARVPAIFYPLTQFQSYTRITFNVADVSRLHAMLCYKPELVFDASIPYWCATWLPGLPSFRFEQRISGQRQTYRKRELDRRVQKELLNRVYDSMFHFALSVPIRAFSLRVAVVFVGIIVIFFAVAIVFLFVFFLFWLLAKEDIGRQPIRRAQVGAFKMYSAHVQWYASLFCKRSDNGRRIPRQQNVMPILKAGVLYFAVVFGAGFVLGTIRTLWVVQRVGVRTAELMEMPIMLAVTIVAARWTVLRLSVPMMWSARLEMGCIALVLMLIAEFGFVLWIRGLSIKEYFSTRDPVSGATYYLLLIVFAIMPFLARK